MLRIVQPNIPQNDKWRLENAASILQTMLAMSGPGTGASAAHAPTHVIWPESSVPFLIDEKPEALNAVGGVLPDDSVLLMGSLRRSKSATGTDPAVYNSLLAIDGAGRVLSAYDKRHLVPFGEYLPFAHWLEPLGFRRLVTVPGSFSPGQSEAVMAAGAAGVVAPLICYEAIFPGQVTRRGQRPGWVLNVTNDGWFGTTGGPQQHFAQARFRAIEEGLPLVRAANTGISAVVDPYGRVLAALPVGARAVIDSRLPASLPPTVYARYGDFAFFLMLAGGAVLGVGLGLRRARRPRWAPT